MIKTDKVIYRTRTQEEFDWLMKKLDEACCMRESESGLFDLNMFCEYKSGFCVRLGNKRLGYSDFDFYKNESEFKDYEFIEVSDLMENEKKTEILDKLETMNEYLNNKLKKLEEEEEDDESRKIKKIVYTTEIYFE